MLDILSSGIGTPNIKHNRKFSLGDAVKSQAEKLDIIQSVDINMLNVTHNE